jgi:uncharacterized spore protein YtfJ
MDVNEVIDRARDAINVRRVFGEPIQQEGTTLVPAAWVSGGGGGGSGEGPAAEGAKGADTARGQGSGFGVRARPAGVFVMRNGKVSWTPAVDVNRIVLGAQVVMGLFLLTMGRGLVRRLSQGTRPLGRRRWAW